METRGGYVSFLIRGGFVVFYIIVLYYSPALAQLNARYALGALCVVCDER